MKSLFLICLIALGLNAKIIDKGEFIIDYSYKYKGPTNVSYILDERSNEINIKERNNFYKDEELNYVNKVEKETAYGEGRQIFIEKSYYNVTTIGRTFIKACSNSEAIDYKA